MNFSHRLAHGLLYSTVFLTGAVVLILEVAAVRMLAPIFGSSIYVLSSVLSTILLALSVGYYIGGKLSDRWPYYLPLYWIITTAGVCILAFQLLALAIISPLGTVPSLVVGPLIFSLLFFFLPAFLLGMDSPYVIKLLTYAHDDSHSGSYVGSTFFWSTVGSITGSLASGFYLLPTFGVQTTITVSGIVLILLGLFLPWLLRFLPSDLQMSTKPPALSSQAFYVLLVLSLAIFFLWQLQTFRATPPGVLYRADGQYSRIIVTEEEDSGQPIRRLRRDANNSSAIFLGNTEHVFEYSRFVDLYPALVPESERFLMIGGGAYTIPRRVLDQDPTIEVDVVEIEPSLFQLAQTYFELPDSPRLSNHVGDARLFLRQTPHAYEVIFTDAMNTAYAIPFHLTTREYYEDIDAVLAPNGIVFINLITSLSRDHDSLLASVVKTLSTVFPHVEAFTFKRESDPSQLRNVVLIVSRHEISEDTLSELTLTDKQQLERSLFDLRLDLSMYDIENALVLTDDHAPVEQLLAKQLPKI